MRIEFVDEIPATVIVGPVLISGAESAKFPNSKYVLIKPADKIEFGYEIRLRQDYYSQASQAEVYESLLVIGIAQDFYIYNYSGKFSVAKIEMEGYFGQFRILNGLIYVADMYTLRCIDKVGRTKWQSEHLAADGVIIHDMDDEKIIIHGQYDPPDGWEMFVLDTKTGRIISRELI